MLDRVVIDRVVGWIQFGLVIAGMVGMSYLVYDRVEAHMQEQRGQVIPLLRLICQHTAHNQWQADHCLERGH